MAIAEQLDQISKAPLKYKAIAAGVFLAALAGVFYYFFYAEILDRADQLQRQSVQMEKEKADLEEKKQKYMAFRAEVTQLLEEQKELIRVLPAEDEIPSFLQSIHAQAELAGLSILTFEQRPTVKQGFYARIPVVMNVTGTYHRILHFFYAVGAMKRIVNIGDVRMGRPVITPLGVQLRATFVASTFRFLPPPKGGGRGAKGKKKG